MLVAAHSLQHRVVVNDQDVELQLAWLGFTGFSLFFGFRVGRIPTESGQVDHCFLQVSSTVIKASSRSGRSLKNLRVSSIRFTPGTSLSPEASARRL